jgi:hypothetical protein
MRCFERELLARWPQLALFASERMSVTSKFEGGGIEMFAGRVASEGIVWRELAEYGFDGAPIGLEGCA